MTDRGLNETRAVVVKASGITRSFGSHAARVTPVDAVDLTLFAGELVTLAGPSGSGKSTLLHLLTGFDTCDSGTVRWVGVAANEAPPWDVVGVVPQSLGLLPELTIFENVSFPLTLAKGRRAGNHPEDASSIMIALDIDHLRHRLPAETSLGQQQRASVARAVIARPRLILADEPASHQDDAHADAVMAILRCYVDSGSACLIASHDRRLDAGADRRLRLVAGRLEQDGPR